MSGRAIVDRLLALARIFVGAVFVYASLDKIANPELFSQSVANYAFLPYALNNLFALCLPPCELLIGVALILGIFVRPSALLVSLMSLSFAVGVTRARIIGLDIDCGCFTQDGSGSNITILTVLRDNGLFVLCAAIWWLHSGVWGLGSKIKALR
ncbi:MAG: MauE/DoxX family redox-associated membrane protein [Candidatus Alcyoniella australis]|nr:MauE/DoxX family redox-associated membrane protein [Candidatus Alcyoniella australis]